jgi:hypothetical protein
MQKQVKFNLTCNTVKHYIPNNNDSNDEISKEDESKLLQMINNFIFHDINKVQTYKKKYYDDEIVLNRIFFVNKLDDNNNILYLDIEQNKEYTYNDLCVAITEKYKLDNIPFNIKYQPIYNSTIRPVIDKNLPYQKKDTMKSKIIDYNEKNIMMKNNILFLMPDNLQLCCFGGLINKK